MIIIGSLGNNLGNNLVSLDHKQKQEEKAELERQQKEDAKGQKSEASLMIDLEQGGTTAGSTAGSDKGNCSIVHPHTIKCEKGHDAHKIVGKHIAHDALEKGITHPETQHMCTVCNLKELEHEIDGWYRCHVCDLNKCAHCALNTDSAKTSAKPTGINSSHGTATSVAITDTTHVPNCEVVVGKPENKKGCSYRAIGTCFVIVMVAICTNTPLLIYITHPIDIYHHTVIYC